MTPREAYEKAAKSYPDVEFLRGFDANDEVYVFLTTEGFITVNKRTGFSFLETSPCALLDCFKTNKDYCDCYNHRTFSITTFEYADYGNLYTTDNPDEAFTKMITEQDALRAYKRNIKGK